MTGLSSRWDVLELNSELFNGEANGEPLKSTSTDSDTDGGINGGIKNVIAANAGIDVAQLVAILGKSRRTVERAVAQLKKERIIEYRGSKKTGGYYLVGRE